jgi:protein TonB
MIDPVSKELERREHLDVPWKWAVFGALALHLAVAATFLLAPTKRPRALSLPRIQVRISAVPMPAPARARPAPAAPTKPPAPVRSPKPAAKRAAEPPPKHAIPPKKAAKQVAPAPAEEPEPAAPAAPPGAPAASAGGIALGVGGTGGEDSFPFSYYLNRVVSLIESNWFRPPATAGSRCRVRCVIDRSGRLVEAGLEQESQVPAFDRAALRAVYAAVPFPPLPQAFGGNTLTLHLEFGP